MRGLFGSRVAFALRQRLAVEETDGPPASKAVPLIGAALHAAVVLGLARRGRWGTACAWAVGVGGVYPLLNSTRQLLEHRDDADPARGALTRMFTKGPLSSIIGGAGFNRHLLHHWDASVSYTRFRELEDRLQPTDARPIMTRARLHLQRAVPAHVATRVTSVECPPCPVCAGAAELWADTTDVEYRTSDQVWHYARCQSCATLFLIDPPRDRLDEIYPANYYSYGAENSFPVRVKEMLDRRTLRTLCSRIPGVRLRLLDVGGGVGAMASLVRGIEPRITESVIVDLDDRAAPLAEAAGHRFVTSRIEDFDEPSQFDVILMLNLIEHVADPVAVLSGARRLATPDSRVLVKTPNVEGWDAKVLRHRDWGGYHAPRHWVLFTPDTFRLVAEHAGFVVERMDLTQGGPFWTVGVMSMLERRRLLRRKPGQAMVQHPLFGVFTAGFAAFDLVRAKFGGRTSQMFVYLRPAT